MTYYGTQRNWWIQLFRLLFTLLTITQHSMAEIDASRAQQQTNHHIMMGLGGGAKSASAAPVAVRAVAAARDLHREQLHAGPAAAAAVAASATR